MRLYRISSDTMSVNRFLAGIFAVTVACVLFLASDNGLSAGPDGRSGSRSSEPVAVGNEAVKDSKGPTILLAYSKEGSKKIPISSFMYFVPLISPTLVDRETSINNEQQVVIISYEHKLTSKSFNVVCEFEVSGKGFHKNTFDAAERIASNTEELQKGKSMKNLLDFIKIEGEGLGRIEVRGTMIGSAPSVTEVDMSFNARGRKSPVTVGLYDIIPKDGQYRYENRSNQIVARVNSLIFKNGEKIPHMGIKLASITDKSEPDGFFGDIKGAIANLFIPPPKVAKLGNDTMLDFGHTLSERKPAFTFPKAKNIKENRPAVTVPAQK